VQATLRVVSGAHEATVPAGQPFVVGRARNADFVLPDSRVSRQHLLIETVDGGWSVRDISSNGEARFRLGTPTGPEVVVLVEAPAGYDSHPHFEEPTVLGDATGYEARGPRMPDYQQRVPAGVAPPRGGSGGRGGWPDDARPPGGELSGSAPIEREHERRTAYRLRPGMMSIGRSRDNDIVVADLLASRRHAELYVGRGGVEIADLDSANGTFVNGQRITRIGLGQRDVIAVGHHVFQVDGDELVEYIDSGDVSFEADGLNVYVTDKDGQRKAIMNDMTFRLPGRALLGVVGPSGAGKSTLLGALTGFRPADTGSVRYAGRDLYSEYDELRRRIGYVPQDDLLHTSLTVRTALEYGAELRFPPDTTKAERGTRVDEVLAELGLTQHADKQVTKLSGGQRKRTSVALELLTKPTLLYLDEPTSGLDPGMDKNVMESLRKLADDGRTVIVVTHSVAQLDLCDYVLVLAPGGFVAYFGPPRDALPFFQKKDYPDVFLDLEATAGPVSASRFRESPYYVPASITAPSARPPAEDLPSIRQQPVRRQLFTLSRRTFSVVASDRSYLRLIIAFPFLLGLIPRAIPGNFSLPGDGSPNSDAGTIFLVMVLCGCFMGMANSVREIVKERAIYQRERAIGLSRTAYLGSKILVLFIITILQSIPFTAIGLLGRTPSSGVILGNSLLECFIAVVMISLASGMLGLLISAMVDNADKTMPLLVLLTMAQLVLSGGILPVHGKPGLDQVSMVAPARWGFAALSSVADLNTIGLAGKLRPDNHKLINPKVVFDPYFKHTSTAYLTDIGAGLLVGVVCITITSLLLRKLDPKTGKRRK
jgi:ABC-type multidrug transport system ATPase subunit/pSer/pThr/pTyr-binding forkhead associated (FHA) protein